jgi:hypothetical protein
MGKARILLPFLALGQVTCNQAIMTAPAGSTLVLRANPDLIPSNGGVSVITALVVEPAGTVVADGTVVQFFTNLGDIEEQGKTNDGVARVNLRANGRSGVATVTAFSGGDAVPAPSPSATATPTTGVPVSAAAGTASAAANDTTDVTIGTAGAASIFASANPPQITNARGSSLIRATVFDGSGNPLPGVPVFFSVAATQGSGAYLMDSGGRPVFTDSNGQALDNLRVRSVSLGANEATVTVTVPLGSSSSAEPATVVVPIIVAN